VDPHLVWPASLVAAAGSPATYSHPGGLPQAGWLAWRPLRRWGLRFRPSEQAHAWRRCAEVERHTARLLDWLTRDGYMVFHALAVPGSLANLDHLVIGPTGLFVIDTKQWTGSVHQSADELAWHYHSSLDRTLATVRWEVEAIGRLLGTHTTPWCASTAPTSMAAACTPRAGPSCRPASSVARSAMTGSFPTPRWSCSPPPPGPGSTRPPDRSKRRGKDIEGQREHASGLLAARGLLQLWLYDTPALSAGIGGSQHGKTTTDGHHRNARQGA
jgi:hypothetical protein